MQAKTHFELIEIIDKQNKIIKDLVAVNAEKENMVNVLMKESIDIEQHKESVR